MSARSREQLLRLKHGQVIAGRYHIIDAHGKSAPGAYATTLGDGGTGMVFLAEQRFSKRAKQTRAVKFFVYREDIAALSAHRHSSHISASAFAEELTNLCNFHHENVVKVLDGGVWRPRPRGPQVPFLVTEHIKGPTLRALLDPAKRPALEQLLQQNPQLPIELTIQLCRGIEHLHSHSFYHCDIAPKNIFLEHLDQPRCRVVIGDLGLGRTLPLKSSSPKTFVAGTRDYCPRQVRDQINKSVVSSLFDSLQPQWDLYATARTILDLLAALEGHPQYHTPWLTALRHLLVEATKADMFDLNRIPSATALLSKVEWLHPQHHTLAQIQELTERYPGNRQLPLPVDPVTTSKRIRQLVRHPALLRLKRVPQLLMSSAIFNSATHSRYEHSLGTYQATRRYLLALMDDENFLAAFDSSLGELALVAALLSNITRHPFSSVIHEIQSRDPECYCTLAPGSLYDELVSHFPKVQEQLDHTIATWFPRVDQRVLRGILTNDPESFQIPSTHFIHFLLNSSLDARVLDFLRRDALSLGLSRGDPIEFEELLRHVRFLDGELVVRVQGLSVVEQVITLRYWLFNRIYWNSPNRALMAMLKQIFAVMPSHCEGFEQRLRPVLLYGSEWEILDHISAEAERANMPSISKLCTMLRSDEPQRYEEIGQYNRAEDAASAHVICDKLAAMSGAQYMELNRRLDHHVRTQFDLSQNTIHLLIDMPIEVRGRKLGEDINVLGYRGACTPLVNLSGIVAGAQQGFLQHLQRMRCFASPEAVDVVKDKQRLWREAQVVLRTVP